MIMNFGQKIIKVILNNEDITECVTSVFLGGSLEEIANTLTITYIASNDYYTPKIIPNLGDDIEIIDVSRQKQIFKGKVYIINRVGQQGELTFDCFDNSYFLGQSTGTFVFQNATAETIARHVLNEVNINIGHIEPTGIKQKIIFQNDNLFYIIKKVYENASLQNSKRYVFKMIDDKFNILELGQEKSITLEYYKDLIDYSYQENAQNIISRIKVYDKNNKFLFKIEDKEMVNKFGIFQNIILQEENKDMNSVAKNSLIGIEKTLNLECVGNTACVKGSTIEIKNINSESVGQFIIVAHNHNFTNNSYTMNLELIQK